ncbi:DUF645 family protein, partial [Vibrio cholerae]
QPTSQLLALDVRLSDAFE